MTLTADLAAEYPEVAKLTDLSPLEETCVEGMVRARAQWVAMEAKKRSSSETYHQWLTVRAIEKRFARTLLESRALRDPWPAR